MNIVLGIIIKDKQILIGKVKNSKLKDFSGLQYAFPGGQVNANETSENAVVREVKEETDLDVEVVNKIGEREHPRTLNYTEYFHCKVLTSFINTINEGKDIEKLIWIDIEKLEDYMPSLFSEVEFYLKRYLS